MRGSSRKAASPIPEFVDLVFTLLHDKYWKTEEAMAEGNPVQGRSKRGETASPFPPVLYIQDSRDIVHPRVQLERFVELYRNGGRPTWDLELSEGAAARIRSAEPLLLALGRA